MKLDGDWIEATATQQVMTMLLNAGHQAYFVGGCVRNALLGLPVGDIDITTDARPDAVVELARKAALKAIPTGIDHGTVTVVSGSIPHEVTTFRSDVETDGRHAKVAFSDTVNEDAMRRDFTMNALYADASGGLVDPLGGYDDLRARKVRFIGKPEDRIREDYLRILRFFRFHALYGDADAGLDPDGLAACAELAEGVERLSKERIGAEMLKMLGAANPSHSVAAMRSAGVLQRVLSGADDTWLAPLVHLETETDTPQDVISRLAALGGEGAEDALRLSKKQARHLATLQSVWQIGAEAAELGYRFGAADGRQMLLLRHAMAGQPIALTQLAELQRGAHARFPVRAADLMPELDGAALGAALARLEARWIASDFTLTRDALLASRGS